jgi:phospho-N-acetylmuramoyl-pentapeptide-transferase
MSDIIQVSYFKLTHGKRVFKMAPLHHHFEMCGWSEEKLFTVFSGVSLVFAVISFLAVMGRYSL